MSYRKKRISRHLALLKEDTSLHFCRRVRNWAPAFLATAAASDGRGRGHKYRKSGLGMECQNTLAHVRDTIAATSHVPAGFVSSCELILLSGLLPLFSEIQAWVKHALFFAIQPARLSVCSIVCRFRRFPRSYRMICDSVDNPTTAVWLFSSWYHFAILVLTSKLVPVPRKLILQISC